MNTPEVSIVVPQYNEEGNVGPLCASIREALDGWERSYEVVLVDDGSSDDTLERMRAEAGRDGRVRVLALSRNSGQTLAMAVGFRNAAGRVIVSMDGDLQNDPQDIPRLVDGIERGSDVVCGWRKTRRDAWLSRTLPSKMANRLIAWMTGIPIHDNGCSLKAYRAEVIRSLNLYSEMHRFLPALSSMTGARIEEVVVRHHPRVHGRSKYGMSRTLRVLGDMITIKMVTQFAARPGLWFGLLSIPWLLLGCVSLLAWMVGLLWYGADGKVVLPSIAVIALYLFGHMIMLSVLGEIFLAHVDRGYLDQLKRVLSEQRVVVDRRRRPQDRT